VQHDAGFPESNSLPREVLSFVIPIRAAERNRLSLTLVALVMPA
jgi:hypothetical protein